MPKEDEGAKWREYTANETVSSAGTLCRPQQTPKEDKVAKLREYTVNESASSAAELQEYTVNEMHKMTCDEYQLWLKTSSEQPRDHASSCLTVRHAGANDYRRMEAERAFFVGWCLELGRFVDRRLVRSAHIKRSENLTCARSDSDSCVAATWRVRL